MPSKMPCTAWAALATFAACSNALQLPLQKPLDSHPISSPSVAYNNRPLIDTQELQDLIKVKNLYKRAEKLYDIAKSSEEEYNHPTRVIGSEGKLS